MSSFSGDTQRVYIIFPCYNEEEGLEKLMTRFQRVSRVAARPFEYVVVNDGSHDHTAVVAKSFEDEMSMTLIDFPQNRGVSAVFNTAFEHVLSLARDDDVVVTIDSDNTMNPFLTLDMFEALDHSDIVVASRFIKGGKMVGAGYRTWLSYGASWLMQWSVGIPNLTDYTIFYRALRAKTLARVCEYTKGEPVAGHGFSAMANFLIHLWRMDPSLKFHEVPLVLRYDLKQGGSSLRMFLTIWGYIVLAWANKRGGR